MYMRIYSNAKTKDYMRFLLHTLTIYNKKITILTHEWLAAKRGASDTTAMNTYPFFAVCQSYDIKMTG